MVISQGEEGTQNFKTRECSERRCRVSPELAFEFTVALGGVRRCDRWERGRGVEEMGWAVGSQDFLFPAEAPQGGMCQRPGTPRRTVALARPGGSVLVSLRDHLDG